MYEASFYQKQDNKKVKCTLCPHYCTIEDGKFGDCNARRNRGGLLSSEVYARISAFNMDPIEKKPLYHFYPGSEILSVGTTGCNMHCVFCQNHTLSQCNNRKPVLIKTVSPNELFDIVLKSENNMGVAFTYNEPSINYEYVMETSRLVKKEGLKTVMVSNGFINRDPMDMLLEYIDAFNIDLKAFNDFFYQRYSKALLKPVLKTIKKIASRDKHLELTNLVIPTLNDDEDEFEDMCKWIVDETGPDTVLHISRYFPRHELSQYPTPPELLFSMYDLAKKHLNHVYLGNMATELHSNSYCPSCNALLIERTYFHINTKGIDGQGRCLKCETPVFKYI